MDVIGKEFTLNNADHDLMLKVKIQKFMLILIIMLISILVLSFVLNAPIFLNNRIMLMSFVVLVIVFFRYYFTQIKMLRQFRFELMDQGILLTYTKDKTNFVGSFLQDLSEARTGSRADQFIDWEDLTKIKITPTEMIFYDKGYDFMTANGKIELPKKLSFYPEIEEYIEAFYGHLIQKAG